MGFIISKSDHLYRRIFLGLALLVFLAISPVLIGISGAYLTEWLTGESCHEGNCVWGALGWLAFFTIPLSGVLFLVFALVVFLDIRKLKC